MAGRPWYGGSYADNRGHFDLIDAGGTRYVFVYLGYHVDKAGMAFVNETLAAYPDRVGVLCVHSYFDHDCTLTDQGELLYDAVVAKNPNLTSCSAATATTARACPPRLTTTATARPSARCSR